MGVDVALDSSNHAYITGIAYSNEFPGTRAHSSRRLAGANAPPTQNPNVFVAKFDTPCSGGASLVYATYLGAPAIQGSPRTPGMATATWDSESRWTRATRHSSSVRRTRPVHDPITGQDRFPGNVDLRDVRAGPRPRGNASTNVGFVSKLSWPRRRGNLVVLHRRLRERDRVARGAVPGRMRCDGRHAVRSVHVGRDPEHERPGFPRECESVPERPACATGGKSNATLSSCMRTGSRSTTPLIYGGSGNGTNADAGIAVAVDRQRRRLDHRRDLLEQLTLVNAAFSTYEGGGNTRPPATPSSLNSIRPSRERLR